MENGLYIYSWLGEAPLATENKEINLQAHI